MTDIMREWNEALTAPKCEHGHLAPVCDLCKKDAEIARLTAERDAAFAMSRCECATDEACAELAKLRDQLHLAEVVRASQVEGLTQGAAGWRERANQLEAEVAGLLEDAFLYRWLREQHESSDSGETMRVYRPDVGRGCLMPVSIEPGQLNAAIDAARKGAK